MFRTSLMAGLASTVLLTQLAPAAAADPRSIRALPEAAPRALVVEAFEDAASTVTAAPGVEVSVATPVQFAYDSADLTPAARRHLANIAAALISGAAARMTFTIEGHTDATGSAGYNLGLSTRRALSVASYLAALGVPAHRLRTVGLGESRPLAGLSATDARQRRVEFVFGS